VARGPVPPVSTVPAGGSDVYFAFDALAAAEQKHLDRVSVERTLAVISSQVSPTANVITQPLRTMPAASGLEARIARAAQQTESFDAEGICEALLGDHMPAHVFLIGVAYQEGGLPFSAESIEQTIGEGVGAANNLRAFRWGRAAAVDPDSVLDAVAHERPRASSQREPSEAADRIGAGLLAEAELAPETLAVLEWRLRDLVDFQNQATAERYLAVVQRVAEAEREATGGTRTELSQAAARYLYKLTAYKDEYEVARLHLDAAFSDQLRGEFPSAKVAFRLHPPLLRAMGLTRKLAIPSWLIKPLFRTLRASRRVRGTALDPFGYAHVRRVERRLIREYVNTLEELLPVLGSDYETAVAIASLPENVRGYENVKLRGVAAYEAERDELLKRTRAAA
jgi:indolepyruvate ferredoxin oxidoreductase